MLISHAHMDHLDPASIALIEGEPTSSCLAAPPGSSAAGPASSRPARAIVRDRALTIRATHADHDGRRYRFGPAAPTLGYRVEGDRTVYFAGDTGFFPDMAEIGRAGVDVALLPVAGWGARLPPGHLDPLAAARALELLAPQVAVPIHWGTLAPVVVGPKAPAQRVACTRVRRARCGARSRGGRRHDPARRDGRALGRSVSDERLQRHDHEAEGDVDRDRDDGAQPAHALALGIPEPLGPERRDADAKRDPAGGRLLDDAERLRGSARAPGRRRPEGSTTPGAPRRRARARHRVPLLQALPRLWAYTWASQSTATVPVVTTASFHALFVPPADPAVIVPMTTMAP